MPWVATEVLGTGALDTVERSRTRHGEHASDESLARIASTIPPPPKRYRWEAGQPGEGLQVVFSNAIQKLMTSAASGGHDLGRKAIVNEVSRWCRQLSRAACESGTSACDCREHSLTVRA
jgi:hypothetical protein